MASSNKASGGWLSATFHAARGLMPGLGAPARREPAPAPRRPANDAAIDALTGLPTRLGLAVPLANALDRAESSGQPLSLMYLGIDGFTAVNDAYGHETGDAVLVETARRLRALANGQVLLARIAGDEFMLAMQGDLDLARRAAAQVLHQVARPCVTPTATVEVSCSIGLATFPRHGVRHQLAALALTAMRTAKTQGGGSFAEYDVRMGEDMREQQDLARDLRVAVEQRQLELYFQPKIDACSLQVTAAEALLRWHHPKRGIVSPAVFIPIAERHRLIGSIGNWVVDEATRLAGQWRDKGLRMRVAINVSAYQMRQDDFCDRLERALKANRLQPSRFTCEITETVAMEDTQVTQRTFERLRALGLHVSIDDFGTGHSSLATLRRLPAAELKIDRAFVTDLATSEQARTIVDTIIKMAHGLSLRVVAEGVETVAQRELLVQMGCDELQGYLFARPMSARALALWAVDDNLPETLGFRSSLFKETDQAANA